MIHSHIVNSRYYGYSTLILLPALVGTVTQCPEVFTHDAGGILWWGGIAAELATIWMIIKTRLLRKQLTELVAKNN